MADIKKRSDKASNRWVTGTTPIYCWKDGTKLRLTDKSAVPAEAIVLSVHENIDHIPQNIIDDVAMNNEDKIIFTQYKSRNRIRVIDKLITGKSQTIQSRTPTTKNPSKNNGLRGIFDTDKVKPKSGATIRVFDGSSFWVGEPNNRPAEGYYWWDWVATYTQEVTGNYNDPYRKEGIRVIDGVAVTGYWKHEYIEVLNVEGRTNPEGGGDIPILNTIGKYSCSGRNWYYDPDNIYYPRSDTRDMYTYVGMGTYEEIISSTHEDRFDKVLASGDISEYLQFGNYYTYDLDIGVKTKNNEYCILSPLEAVDREYVLTKPPEVIISGGQWINILTNQPYEFPEWGYGENEFYSSTFGIPNYTQVGVKSHWGCQPYYPLGTRQQISDKNDEMLHLSFTDSWGVFCDFNTSDSDNFYLSTEKGITGITGTNRDILIPHHSNPTIDVILIPAKWKYWLWLFGIFGGSNNPTWLCTSYEGSPPNPALLAGFTVHVHFSEYEEVANIGNQRYDEWVHSFMYGEPLALYGQPMNYRRWGYIPTPNGLTYGPVFACGHYTWDILGASTSLWWRLGSDASGNVPKNPSSATKYCPPGYSAWTCPRTAGQLVAIIRMTYENGAIDHRYVYSKTNSTAAPILRGYGQIYENTKQGHHDGVWWITPSNLVSNWSGGALGSTIIEDQISTAYVNYYQWYIDTYY